MRRESLSRLQALRLHFQVTTRYVNSKHYKNCMLNSHVKGLLLLGAIGEFTYDTVCCGHNARTFVHLFELS